VVMATVRMTRIWSPTLAAEFGERGSVFLCDESNRVIAHANSSLLLQPCGQGGEPGQGVVRGLDRKGVLRVNHPFSLSNTPLWCVADWPVSEAFAITWQNAAFTVVATVFCLSVGLFFGLAAVRRIVAPLENLAREVAQIRAGNLDTRMTEEGDEEVRQLAVTVNAMTRRLLVDIERRREAEARLIEAREKLEQRVNERTTELRESNAKLLLEIEERKTAEAELAASEAKFRELFNQAEDYILVMDVAAGRIGIILDANDAAFRMHGYERGEFLDRHISEIDASPRELYDEQFRRLFLGERVRFETLHRRRDGSIFPVEVVATLCTAGGRDYILSVERDITERKQAEDALLQATEKLEERVRERTSELLAANEALQGEIEQRTAMEKEREKIRVKAMTQGKLASLGEIATGVAHEINQPLTYLRIIFDSILRDMERDRLDLAELGEECRESLRQISRISVIIDHLRVFGRAKSMDRVEVRIDRVVRDSLVLMRERLRTRKILLDNRLDASLPAILGNAVKLEEVFLNLFQNAIDALEGRDNGVICIEASLEEEGKMLLIRFTDNGPGIPEEIREKIFEPFFTTKEVGKGTGLGLSIVFGIVKEHGGAIECESAPGEFTTFVITLPVGHPFGEEPDAD